LLVAVISLVGATLNGIYVAALYRYAVEGEISPQFFQASMIQDAFMIK